MYYAEEVKPFNRNFSSILPAHLYSKHFPTLKSVVFFFFSTRCNREGALLLNIFYSQLSYQVIEETFYYGVSNFQEFLVPFTIYNKIAARLPGPMYSTTELSLFSTWRFCSCEQTKK